MTLAGTHFIVPEPALVPAQGELLLIVALTQALLTVEDLLGVVTDLLLLQAVTITSSVLLYFQHSTGLGAQAHRQPAGGEHHWDQASGGADGDTAV